MSPIPDALRVINLGFPKSGTTTLGEALKQAGHAEKCQTKNGGGALRGEADNCTSNRQQYDQPDKWRLPLEPGCHGSGKPFIEPVELVPHQILL